MSAPNGALYPAARFGRTERVGYGGRRPRAGRLSVRLLGVQDDEVVRQIFRETLLLGRPVALAPDFLERYEELCMGWYLGIGRPDAAVLVDEGAVVGYTLVCTRPDDHRRWEKAEAARFVRFVVPRLLSGHWDERTRAFCWRRLHDGYLLWRRGRTPPAPAHAHVNVAKGFRHGTGLRVLVEHIDDRCRRIGLPAWYGEMNAPQGRRAAAVGRLGAEIVDVTPNRTLSWAAGERVERITLIREVPPPREGPDAQRATHPR